MKLSTACSSGWVIVALAALLQWTAVGLAGEPLLWPAAGWSEVAEPTASVDGTGASVTNGTESSDCSRKWSMRFIPYGWVPGFNGNLTVHNVTAPVDVSIGKSAEIIADSIDFGALGQIEASNGRFGFIFNGIYVDVSPKDKVSNLHFSDDLAMTILDLTATVNLESVPEALCLPQGSRFEVLAGFRFVSLSSGVTVTDARGNSGTDKGTEDWFDPIVGCRLRVPLTQCLTAQVRGDVGGFSIGEASRFTWNIEATLERRCSDHCSLIAGYRWLDIDRVSGSGSHRFGFDMNLNGPIVGFAFDF